MNAQQTDEYPELPSQEPPPPISTPTGEKSQHDGGPQAADELFQSQMIKMRQEQLTHMAAIANGTQQIVKHAQIALKNLPEDFHNGLDQVKNMFWIQFVLGILLLIASIPLNILGYDILTAIFGATGGLTLVTTFITSSPLQLQKNRVALAQWVTAHFNWINTLMATSGAVQAMYDNNTLTWENFKDAHIFLLNLTTTTMHNVHDMCEFSHTERKRKPREAGSAKPGGAKPQPEKGGETAENKKQ